MDLVREIMFGGTDALLYRALSEDTGLIYAYRWPYLEYRNFGTTEIGFHLDPDRLAPTLHAFRRAMQMLLNGEFDLESKQRLLRANWEALQDNTVGLNAGMLHNLMLTDSPEPPDWEAVTKDAVIACAQAAFSSGVEAILHKDEWALVQEKMNQALAAADGTSPDAAGFAR